MSAPFRVILMSIPSQICDRSWAPACQSLGVATRQVIVRAGLRVDRFDGWGCFRTDEIFAENQTIVRAASSSVGNRTRDNRAGTSVPDRSSALDSQSQSLMFVPMQAVTRNILKFTATGLVAGVVLGWLLSLPSGNYFVTLGVATLGLFIGVILGIVHRHDA